MFPYLTDSQFNSLALIAIAAITIVPATLSVMYSRSAKKNSAEARTSAEAAAHEVLTNGGMSDPNPNLNDHIKYQTEMLEALSDLPDRVDHIERQFDEHVRYANYMGQGMAEMYLHFMGKDPRPIGDHPDS